MKDEGVRGIKNKRSICKDTTAQHVDGMVWFGLYSGDIDDDVV